LFEMGCKGFGWNECLRQGGLVQVFNTTGPIEDGIG
jgi:hypothetical protein